MTGINVLVGWCIFHGINAYFIERRGKLFIMHANFLSEFLIICSLTLPNENGYAE